MPQIKFAQYNRMSREPRDLILGLRITRSLSDQIEKYRTKYHKTSRTEAVIQLLKTGLYMADKASELRGPAIVQYLQDNLYNMQIVDDVVNWPQDRVEAILGLLASKEQEDKASVVNRKTPNIA